MFSGGFALRLLAGPDTFFHWESGWAVTSCTIRPTLANCPSLFLILLARLFVNPDFASWSGDGEQLHWIGQWDGFPSLYNHPTLGLAWLCLLLTVALWLRSGPASGHPLDIGDVRRRTGRFSGVFASFVNVIDLEQVIGYTAENIAGRYLLPVLLAWFATMLTMFFAGEPPSTPTSFGLKAKTPLGHQPQPGLAAAGRKQKTKKAGNSDRIRAFPQIM